MIARQRALLAAGYKGSSTDRYQSAGSTFANWLVEREYLDRSPFRRLPRIPIDDMAFYALDDGGIVLLERACERYARTARRLCDHDRAVLRFAEGRGIALEWADIDLDKRQLTVRAATTKTRKGRVGTMPRKLVAFIRQRRDELPAKRPLDSTRSTITRRTCGRRPRSRSTSRSMAAGILSPARYCGVVPTSSKSKRLLGTPACV